MNETTLAALRKIHPALALRLPAERSSVLLVRDILRQRISQYGDDGELPIDGLNEVLGRLGGFPLTTASCGPASFALSVVCSAMSIPVEVVSFLWLDDGDLRGHTAACAKLPGDEFVIDMHAGVVWQDKEGGLANLEGLGKQLTEPWGGWRFYPSTHGNSSPSHLMSALKYVFGFWGFDFTTTHGLVGVVTHTVSERESFSASAIDFYGDAQLAAEALALVRFDRTQARLTLNGNVWDESVAEAATDLR
jgi:hypothetical protein